MVKTVLVLMGAGIDSTVLAAYYQKKGYHVSGLFVRHNQPKEKEEAEALERIDSSLGIITHRLWAPYAFSYDSYFGPMRNAFLLTIAENFVQTTGRGLKAKMIGIGLCEGEYLDVRPEFVDRFNFLLDMCLDKPVYIDAPFAHRPKKWVIRYGLKIGAPLDLTTSCMDTPPCGKCQDCVLREKFGIGSKDNDNKKQDSEQEGN